MTRFGYFRFEIMLVTLSDSFKKVFSFKTDDEEYATVWSLLCPSHYRALGVAVTVNEKKDQFTLPDGTVFCIRASLATSANWQLDMRAFPLTDDPFRNE